MKDEKSKFTKAPCYRISNLASASLPDNCFLFLRTFSRTKHKSEGPLQNKSSQINLKFLQSFSIQNKAKNYPYVKQCKDIRLTTSNDL